MAEVSSKRLAWPVDGPAGPETVLDEIQVWPSAGDQPWR